jgi:hypothetical protein
VAAGAAARPQSRTRSFQSALGTILVGRAVHKPPAGNESVSFTLYALGHPPCSSVQVVAITVGLVLHAMPHMSENVKAVGEVHVTFVGGSHAHSQWASAALGVAFPS